eukprot:TRINITY_DN21712_c0_g1_i1.p1 TRINITY_DN21712_c0_g1~~TRINITY_DN21712_c0_g1_i1.p1  ORF type:complete len:201 (+),score=42.56 TRINITY_DN21712_c0_g1_i1:73-675(+)
MSDLYQGEVKVKLENAIRKRRKLSRDKDCDWEKIVRLDLRKEVTAALGKLQKSDLPGCTFPLELDMSLEQQWRENRRSDCNLSVSSWEHEEEWHVDGEVVDCDSDSESWGSWGKLSPSKAKVKSDPVAPTVAAVTPVSAAVIKTVTPPASPPPPPLRTVKSTPPTGAAETPQKTQPLKFQRKRAVLHLDNDTPPISPPET